MARIYCLSSKAFFPHPAGLLWAPSGTLHCHSPGASHLQPEASTEQELRRQGNKRRLPHFLPSFPNLVSLRSTASPFSQQELCSVPGATSTLCLAGHRHIVFISLGDPGLPWPSNHHVLSCWWAGKQCQAQLPAVHCAGQAQWRCEPVRGHSHGVVGWRYDCEQPESRVASALQSTASSRAGLRRV